MATNSSTLHRGTTHPLRTGLISVLAAILIAIAGLAALLAGGTTNDLAPALGADDAVEKALIDHRADERASRGVGIPTDEFWAEFRAAEREMR